MFRLIRWLFSLLLLAGAIYFAVAVPLGEKTLWQHARAIAGTRESQQLVDEVKRKAGLKQAPAPAPKEARPAEAKHAENAAASDKSRLHRGASAGGEQARFSDEERKLLRKLIRERLPPPAE